MSSATLHAYPNAEKTTLSLLNNQATSQATMALEDNRYLYLAFGSTIKRIDTETWALATDQIPTLSDSRSSSEANLAGDITGLAIHGGKLYAAQSDGDLVTIDLDHITSTPTVKRINDGALGALVADSESGSNDNILYIADKAHNAVLVYDISTEEIGSVSLNNDQGVGVAPVSLVFVPFPTSTNSSTIDKVFVTTNSGLVFEIPEGGSGSATSISLSTTNKDLPVAAVTPSGDFLLVVNSTDTSISVINTATLAVVDADSSTSGVNPIDLVDDNGTLKGLSVVTVNHPSDVYAYVTGSSGISVLDLTNSSTFGDPIILDKITTASAPAGIVSSTTSDGYLYTTNGNASISIISEKPFVTIGSTSLGTSSLTSTGSFTITFKSDEVGTYQVYAGGDLSRNGTLVASGTVSAVNTDTTTSAISYSTDFDEGTNRFLVFVTDADGFVGRDAVDITVDTPPTAPTLQSVSFGNQKLVVTWDRQSISDLDHYNLFVSTESATVASTTTVSLAVTQPASGTSGSIVTGELTGLTNNTLYYVAIESVDDAGNKSSRVTTLANGSPATGTPESTRGLAESVGETGCSLNQDSAEGPQEGLIIFYGLPLMMLWLISKIKSQKSGHGEPSRTINRSFSALGGSGCPLSVILFFLSLFISTLLSTQVVAKELTPQRWSLELKGGAWMPLNSTSKSFLGSCCEPMGKAEFGFLYKSQFGFEVGVGYVGASGRSVGATSGEVSGDHFNLSLIPIENSFTYRADFHEDQFFVPYGKFGLDYVFFRENNQGHVIHGMKYGLHTAVGAQILLDKIDELSELMEQSLGVNDVYLVIESRYAWINNFGGHGLDLSNLSFSAGFLFEF